MDKETRKFAVISAAALLMLSLTLNVTGLIRMRSLQARCSELDSLTSHRDDALSEWDAFTLALMKVESEYDNDAVSSVGARGYFQMTPIYVREVNRVHKTGYTFDQVTDFDTAYDIFDLMQKAHNRDYDMDRALELHNGRHEWYNRMVYRAMEEILLYEEMRTMVREKSWKAGPSYR